LKNLYLQNNEIEKVPAFKNNLLKLDYYDFRGNNLKDFPKDVDLFKPTTERIGLFFIYVLIIILVVPAMIYICYKRCGSSKTSQKMKKAPSHPKDSNSHSTEEEQDHHTVAMDDDKSKLINNKKILSDSTSDKDTEKN